jgi:hypothetical protein
MTRLKKDPSLFLQHKEGEDREGTFPTLPSSCSTKKERRGEGDIEL